jgi:hypothetical protein
MQDQWRVQGQRLLEATILEFATRRADEIEYPAIMGGAFVTGSGPLEAEVMEQLLSLAGVELCPEIEVAGEYDLVVVGRENFDKEGIDTLVELAAMREEPLHFAAQEGLIALLIEHFAGLGCPFGAWELTDEHAMSDPDCPCWEHPGLRWLDEEFGWTKWQDRRAQCFPRVVADDVGGLQSPEIGLLRAFGYSVGAKSPRDAIRRSRLMRAINSPLPEQLPGKYRAECGPPGSSLRLSKVKRVLQSLIRNAERKTKVDMTESLRQWRSDLLWLGQQFGD